MRACAFVGAFVVVCVHHCDWGILRIGDDNCQTILINAVTIVLETSYEPTSSEGIAFANLDIAYIAIYTFEFLLKIYADNAGYWRNNYNRFDFLILIISYFYLVQDMGGNTAADSNIDVTFLRVFRALRALRALRSISFVRPLQVGSSLRCYVCVSCFVYARQLCVEIISHFSLQMHLQVIVNALMKTFQSIVNLLTLLLLVVYVFAIVGYYFLGTVDADRWGTLQLSMYSLWCFTTVDGWTDLQVHLDEAGVISSRLFTIAFIFVGHFIFTNLFIGVVIQNLEEAQEEARTIQDVKKSSLFHKKKAYIIAKQQHDLERMLKRRVADMGGKEGESLRKVVQKLQDDGKLSSDDIVPLAHLSCNLIWLETFLATLHYQENSIYRLQQVCYNVHARCSVCPVHLLQSHLSIFFA